MAGKFEKKINGLTSKEARLRLVQYGENVVYKRKRIGPFVLAFKKLSSPLFLILIAASIVAFFLKENINAVILILMVGVSAAMDFFNSYRSQRTVEHLLSLVVSYALVLRDGKKEEINLSKVVPGDVVYLLAGDVVPGDCQVLQAKDFFVNEAVLTGESFPVEKFPQQNLGGKIASKNVAYLGTSVVSGFATVLILKTGAKTKFGQIAKSLEEERPLSDFEKNIQKFSVFILIITAILVTAAFVFNALVGRSILTAFIFAVAIAIGMAPELLPVIISVALSNGAMHMAKKSVIVKNLSSIQDFGSMDILCADKTGSLTQNLIILEKHLDAFGESSEKVLFWAFLVSTLHSGVTNPLDEAVKKHHKFDLLGIEKIDEIPFDFERKRQSVVVKEKQGRILVSAGAPEEIFKICEFYQKGEHKLRLSRATRDKIENIFYNLSRSGYRVLAVAAKEVPTKKSYTFADEQSLVFMGFTAFMDPAKESAREAILELKKLGTEIKILTGDNALVSEKICQEVELKIKGILSGTEIDKMSDKQLGKAVLVTTIFARVTPEQKERIILALKKAKKVVGYLGDGVNDAPALRAADVGISVNNAVDVTKETADIILLHKSLTVLQEGIIEGRKTFLNTRKYIMMGLSSDFGNMFSMAGASLLLPFLPMLPVQIILNDFLYNISQLFISTDKVDKDEIYKIVKWDFAFFRRYMIIFGLTSSIFDFVTFGMLLWVFQLKASYFQTGWFMESIATQVFVIYLIRTKKLPFLQSRPSFALFFVALLVVLAGWLIPYVGFGKFFGFEPLPLAVLGIILAIVIIYLLLAEGIKRIFYKLYKVY